MNRRSLFKALAASPLAFLLPWKKPEGGIAAVANDIEPGLGAPIGPPRPISCDVIEVRFTSTGPGKYQWKYNGPEWAHKQAAKQMFGYINNGKIKSPDVRIPFMSPRTDGVGFIV